MVHKLPNLSTGLPMVDNPSRHHFSSASSSALHQGSGPAYTGGYSGAWSRYTAGPQFISNGAHRVLDTSSSLGNHLTTPVRPSLIPKSLSILAEPLPGFLGSSTAPFEHPDAVQFDHAPSNQTPAANGSPQNLLLATSSSVNTAAKPSIVSANDSMSPQKQATLMQPRNNPAGRTAPRVSTESFQPYFNSLNDEIRGTPTPVASSSFPNKDRIDIQSSENSTAIANKSSTPLRQLIRSSMRNNNIGQPAPAHTDSAHGTSGPRASRSSNSLRSQTSSSSWTCPKSINISWQ